MDHAAQKPLTARQLIDLEQRAARQRAQALGDGLRAVGAALRRLAGRIGARRHHHPA